jgi:hypothetical protein
MMKAGAAVLEVREVSVVRDRVLVVATIIEGDFQPDVVVEDAAGSRWRITGVGFTPADAWSAGYRALTLEPLSGGRTIEPGSLLVAS